MRPDIKAAAEWAENKIGSMSFGTVALRFMIHENRLQYIDKCIEEKQKLDPTIGRGEAWKKY